MFTSDDPNKRDDRRLVRAALACFNDAASCEAFERICAHIESFEQTHSQERR